MECLSSEATSRATLILSYFQSIFCINSQQLFAELEKVQTQVANQDIDSFGNKLTNLASCLQKQWQSLEHHWWGGGGNDFSFFLVWPLGTNTVHSKFSAIRSFFFDTSFTWERRDGECKICGELECDSSGMSEMRNSACQKGKIERKWNEFELYCQVSSTTIERSVTNWQRKLWIFFVSFGATMVMYTFYLCLSVCLSVSLSLSLSLSNTYLTVKQSLSRAHAHIHTHKHTHTCTQAHTQWSYRSIFKVVVLTDTTSRQLALLSNGYKSSSKPQCDNGTEQKATGVQSLNTPVHIQNVTKTRMCTWNKKNA